MLHFRVVRTKDKSRAVQVIRYHSGKRVIVKHIGSGSTNEEMLVLSEIALANIQDISKQSLLFDDMKTHGNVVLLNQCEYLRFYYTFLYDIPYSIQAKIGYTAPAKPMLNDLVIMRILEPASRLRSI